MHSSSINHSSAQASDATICVSTHLGLSKYRDTRTSTLSQYSLRYPRTTAISRTPDVVRASICQLISGFPLNSVKHLGLSSVRTPILLPRPAARTIPFVISKPRNQERTGPRIAHAPRLQRDSCFERFPRCTSVQFRLSNP